MRLTDASVTIRPRSAWEACDLGVLLARRHAGLLTASWALLTLPVFVLCSALLWQQPSLAMLLFWWLKPLYERLPLHILSRALFGATPTLKQAFQALPGLLKPQLLASLTWRRLSLTRSFDLPVLQLEGLNGQARIQRLVVLSQRDARPATWLTIIGSHVEMALWLGMLSLLYLLLPQQWELDWSWSNLIEPDSGSWLWLEHLSNLLYALLLIIWEPVYVACGFSLYLNRRSALEAWDIELAFRRLRQRLSGIATVALLVCGLFLLPPAPSAWAATDEANASCPLPLPEAPGPKAARLLKQPLNSQAAQSAIKQLLEQPPFEHSESVTRWRFAEEASDKPDDAASASSLGEALKHLLELMGPDGRFQNAGPGPRSAAVDGPVQPATDPRLALPRLVAHLRRPPATPKQNPNNRPNPTVWPATGATKPAGRHRRQCRSAVGRTAAGSARPALPRPAQPPAA